MKAPPNIVRGHSFPADWRISFSPTDGDCIIRTPVATYSFSHFGDALLYRDFIVTRSRKPRDRRVDEPLTIRARLVDDSCSTRSRLLDEQWI